MGKPTPKSPGMASLLEGLFGRTTAIEADKCVPSPAGCGGDAAKFRDGLSAREYRISGLCQECQDSVFS